MPEGLSPVRPIFGWQQAAGTLRLRDWWYFAGLPAAALVVERRGALPFALGMCTAAAALAYAYGINSIGDRQVDRDPLKNPLAGWAFAPRPVVALVGGCAGLAVAGAFLLGAPALLAVGVSLTFATLYSVGPHLKAVPGLSLVANVAIFTPLMAVGLTDIERPGTWPILAIAFSAIITESQLVHEVCDRSEDAAGRLRTTAIALGARSAFLAAGLVGIVAGVAILSLSRPPSTSALTGAGLCVGLGLLVALTPPERARILRRMHRLLGMTGGIVLFLLSAASR